MPLINKIIFCFVGVLAIGFALLAYSARTPERDMLTIITKDGQYELHIEIAQTVLQQQKGLMHREHIAEDYGMLFIWEEEAIRSMWMKNTPSPLDMLFIDRHGKVIDIHANAVPYSLDTIKSNAPAMAVLEIAGGSATRKNIAIGDRVVHPFFQQAL